MNVDGIYFLFFFSINFLSYGIYSFEIGSYSEAKKSSLVSENQPGEFFYHLLARIVQCVPEYVFFVHIHTNKKQIETKEEKRISEISNRMQSYCLQFCSVYF